MIYICISVSVLLTVIWACHPEWLGNENRFLADFVTHEVLSVYGVMVAITLANAAQIHLSLNRLEERINKSFFDPVRLELKQNAFGLVASFLIAIVLLTVKGNIEHSRSIAAINAIALFILFFQTILTWDVFSSVLKVSADVRDQGLRRPPTPAPSAAAGESPARTQDDPAHPVS